MLNRTGTLLLIIGALLGGCASIDVKELAVKNLDIRAGQGELKTCPRKYDVSALLAGAALPATADEVRVLAQARAAALIGNATQPYDDFRKGIPDSLSKTAVVETIWRSAKLSSANAARAAFQAENIGKTGAERNFADTMSASAENYIKDHYAPPAALTLKDFRTFVDEFSEKQLRHTKAAAPAKDDDFWEIMEAYYSEYAEGKYIDYFGTKYAKPTLSLTVTDEEMSNVVGLLLEVAFDVAAKTPVWVLQDAHHTGDADAGSAHITNLKSALPGEDPDVSKLGWKSMSISDASGAIPKDATITGIDVGGGGLTLSKPVTKDLHAAKLTVAASGAATYYPGANSNAPSTLTLNKRQPEDMSLVGDSVGCGMTILKSKAMNSLAQKFSSAASNATGTAVGTIGGTGVSLGVFGKLSIGDNKAVTSLIEALVAELVKRTTVEAVYPVLVSLEYDPALASPYKLTGQFKSPNTATPIHHPWAP